LTMSQLVMKMSTNPARILGIPGGTLAPGSPADITLIDPKKDWTVDTAKFASKSRNCPIQGWNLKGRAVMTVVGGEIVSREI
jgi:dihydroorotase